MSSLNTAVTMRRGRTCASMAIILAGWLMSLAVAGSAFAESCTVTLPGYTCTSIDFPGATSTAAFGINDSDHIVGVITNLISPGTHGFLYAGGTFTPIDVVVPGTTTTHTEAFGINKAGHIVGDYGGGGLTQGFLDVGGSFTPINGPGATGPGTSARGINDAGLIVGYYFDATGSHGFLDVGGSVTPIDVPITPIDEPDSANSTNGAFGINTAGNIVGSYYHYVQGVQSSHGFLDVGGTFTKIDVPGATSTSTVWAFGINDAGHIVGTHLNGGVTHGFLKVGGSVTPIDVLGATSTGVSGINNAGHIVGYYTDATGAAHGFLATPSVTVNPVIGRVTDLSPVVTNNGNPVKVGDPVRQNDIIETSSGGTVLITFTDGIQLELTGNSDGNSRIELDTFVFDPNTNEGNVFFRHLLGFFVWTSGLIGKADPEAVHIETPTGCLGIRGTQFIARYPHTANGLTGVRIDLLEGIVDVTPHIFVTPHVTPPGAQTTSFIGPVTFMFDTSHVTPSGLTQDGYQAIKAQLFLYPNLINLVKRYEAKPDVEANMVAKLKAAQAAAAEGKVKLANNQLHAFITQVSAQAKKSLTAEQAATLIQLARGLMT